VTTVTRLHLNPNNGEWDRCGDGTIIRCVRPEARHLHITDSGEDIRFFPNLAQVHASESLDHDDSGGIEARVNRIVEERVRFDEENPKSYARPTPAVVAQMEESDERTVAVNDLVPKDPASAKQADTATTSYLVDEWKDDPRSSSGSLDEWPYPDHFTRYRITGTLATRVLRRAGREQGVVHLIERTISTGYGEYTQDLDYDFTVEVDGLTMWDSGTFYGWDVADQDGISPTYLAALNTWLNEAVDG